jgi:poly(A) polymerase
MAANVCARLKLSTAELERVEWLVKKHQFLCEAPQMRPSKLKTTLARPGIRELLSLHRADALASGRSTAHVEFCEKLLDQWSEADLKPPPLITGHDLEALGLPPGPLYKKLLDAVWEAQLDGTIGTREQALEMVNRMLRDDQAGSDPD